jgi:formamidopyrimidine-DNA glycosylase
MPELPEVEGLRRFLADALVGSTVARAELAAFSALKTFAVPLSSLLGQEVERVERRGKFLGLGVDGSWLVFHLARAGWLRWYELVPPAPAKPGRGPIALRLGFEGGDAEGASSAEQGGVRGFDLTEAGTQKKLAIYVVADLDAVPGIATLGVDPLASGFTEDAFSALLAEHGRSQLKGVLRDQRIFAGIGNAYSDEILQAARLSPFKLAGALASDDVARLYAAMRDELASAIERASGKPPSELKDDKRNSLRVHGKKGQPCPACGTPIAEVSFADSFLDYCPGCQTGGKLLADRRMSKLLK